MVLCHYMNAGSVVETLKTPKHIYAKEFELSALTGSGTRKNFGCQLTPSLAP